MKKNVFNICASFGVLAMLTFSSCSKKLEEAYRNPNADTKVPVEQLLPPIISCMAANSAGHGPYNDYRYLGQYIQNWQFCNAGSLYDRMAGRWIPYGSTAADQTASIFRMHYYDIGQNLMNMLKWAQEEEKWNFVGVGKAIFAWSWLQLTDVQGEVILKDAFNSSLITFKYDTQEEAYNYVRQLCYEALTYLNRTDGNSNAASLATSDAYFYGGDLNRWKKFVYAVLARSYHHLTNKTSYNADSVIHYANLSFSTVADNAMVKFAYTPGAVTGGANFFGPIRGNLGGTADGSNTAIRQGAYIANLLNGSNSAFTGVTDPRAIYLLRKNAAGTFRGLVPNKGQAALPANDRPENFWGVAQTTAVNNTAPGNDNNCRFIFKNAAPLPVITTAEIQFMKAEAYFRKGLKDQALIAYRDGITAHLDMLTTYYNAGLAGTADEITPAVKAAFLANTAVVPATSAGLTMTKIMLQKYIALFGVGVTETWTDMRRFNYTDTDPATNQQVYADFVPPAGSDLWPANNNERVYRVYPRYNSETVWNIEELRRIGADREDFHTKKPWILVN